MGNGGVGGEAVARDRGRSGAAAAGAAVAGKGREREKAGAEAGFVVGTGGDDVRGDGVGVRFVQEAEA